MTYGLRTDTSIGPLTCGGYTGSAGHEEADAALFASWGIDFIKHDYCHSNVSDVMRNVPKMRAAIDATGREMVYYVDADTTERVWNPRTLNDNPRAARSVDELPWVWGPKYATMWKTWKDIYDTDDKYDAWWHIMDNVMHNTRGTELAQTCGRYNMPDMMTIGQGGQTLEEYRTQFALWAIMGAPLISGADIRRLTADHLAILTNPHLLAVDRDPACVQGSLARSLNGAQVWIKPLTSESAKNISFAVLALNTNDDVVVDIPVVFSDYYRGDFAPADFTAARVYDLWKGGAPMGEFRHNLTAKAVAPHSCRAVRVDVLAGADPRPLKTEDDPFAFCGAGEAGIMGELRGESDSPFGSGVNQWCCGNTTWSSFSWRAKATRNVDFSLTPAAALPGGRSNASECAAHPTTAVDCFSFCFNSSNGGGCRPLKAPTGPVPTACQAALDAVCNAPSNAKCINATIKRFGGGAVPMVAVYDTRNTATTHPRPLSEWRCYARNALDPSHKRWNGSVAGGYCEGTTVNAKLAAAFASASACASVQPGKPAYPADTWTDWREFRPSDLTASHANKNVSTTVGAFYCGSYPNEFLDPIQHLVLNLRVGGVYFGNSSNITLEVAPKRPSGANYQLTAMISHISSGFGTNRGGSGQLRQPQQGTSVIPIPFMLARENLTTASSHLGPQVGSRDAAVRPLVTEREHNSAIWSTLPQNKKTPKKIVVCQGYHGASDVEGWLDASRALVGFGATAMTGTASVALKQIFEVAGVGAARVSGGLGPPSNMTSHLSLESCAASTRLNGHCWGGSDAEVAANLKLWAEETVLPLRAVGFRNLTQFALHDELGWSYPGVWGGAANISGNPRVFKRFHEYIKKHSGLRTAQAFGAPSWDEVVPITFLNVTKGAANEQALRVRVYWYDRLRTTLIAWLRCHTDVPPCCRSVRFAAYDVQSFYAKATAALVAANDGEFFSIYTSETVMLS